MLQPPEDQDLTVVDAMIWPEITTYVVALAGFGDVPQIAPGLVTPTQMLDFLLRVAVNHKAMPDFHAAAAEAAALAGASWILTPDAPLALANQRYDRVEPPHAFDNILELEAEVIACQAMKHGRHTHRPTSAYAAIILKDIQS